MVIEKKKKLGHIARGGGGFLYFHSPLAPLKKKRGKGKEGGRGGIFHLMDR